MKYHKRLLENKISPLFKIFPIVAITGPRQSGKSTLLQHYIDNKWKYYSLDDRELLLRIKKDPTLFLSTLESNFVIDEAQKAPDLFHSIKHIVDKGYPYKIVLSGSANFLFMKSITESLAGRIGLLELLPFSISEAFSLASNFMIHDIIESNSIKVLKTRLDKKVNNQLSEKKILSFILYGGFPKLYNLTSEKNRWQWFQNYIRTYIERDLRVLEQVGDLDSFQRVYKMFAFQTAQVMNISNIASDVGISVPTVKRYSSILETSYQCIKLPSLIANQRKQLIKSSKMFYMDTGIVNYFMHNDNVERMLNCGSWGALLETWVYSELHKEIKDIVPNPRIYYWRTNNGAEVDFVIEKGDKLYPIEVKSAVQIDSFSLRGLKSFVSAQEQGKVPFSIVFYRGKEVIFLEKKIIAVPITHLF